MIHNFESFTIEGLKYDMYRHNKEKLYLVNDVDKEDFDEQYLGVFLDQIEGELMIALHEEGNTLMVMCISHTNSTTAVELMDYLFGEYGIIRGESYYAEGKMAITMLKMCISNAGDKDKTEYFLRQADRYFTEVKIIDAATYVRSNPFIMDAMDTYIKKQISWAYVRSTKIAQKGTVLRVRSLENDAGVRVTVADDVYIMIGIRGEVYEITKEKFDTNYMESMEVLDVFRSCFDFIPEVEIEGSDKHMAIDHLARLCYPKPGSGVKAAQLQYRTKVFRKGKSDYFVGKAGDYIAIRPEDPTDIYIIQNEVFQRTYEKKES